MFVGSNPLKVRIFTTIIISVPRTGARFSKYALPRKDCQRHERPKRCNVSMQEVAVTGPNNALNVFTSDPDGKFKFNHSLSQLKFL